jgi:hypothetical protein
MLSNFYDLHHEQFDYENGLKIAFSVRVNRKKLASLVYLAANNKGGKKFDGALVIEAKRISGPTTEAH